MENSYFSFEGNKSFLFFVLFELDLLGVFNFFYFIILIYYVFELKENK